MARGGREEEALPEEEAARGEEVAREVFVEMPSPRRRRAWEVGWVGWMGRLRVGVGEARNAEAQCTQRAKERVLIGVPRFQYCP